MNSKELAEAIVHFMFRDLTSADPDHRLISIIYQITLKSFIVNPEEDQEQDFKKQSHFSEFRGLIFDELTKTLDAK